MPRDLVEDFNTCESHLKDTVRLAAFWGTVENKEVAVHMASNILKTFDFVLRSLFPSFFFKPQGLVSLNQANCNWENNGNVCLKSANKEIAVREPFLKNF